MARTASVAVVAAAAIFLGSAVATFLGASPLAAQSGVGQVSLPIGTMGPDAALQDLDGNDVRLRDYTGGGPALIEFWAAWCEQCEALQPQIDRVQEEFGDRVNVIAVAVAVAQSLRRVRRHAERHAEEAGTNYAWLWDDSGATVRAYSANTTSIVVLLDEEGMVAYTGVGPDQDLVGAVETMLNAESAPGAR